MWNNNGYYTNVEQCSEGNGANIQQNWVAEKCNPSSHNHSHLWINWNLSSSVKNDILDLDHRHHFHSKSPNNNLLQQQQQQQQQQQRKEQQHYQQGNKEAKSKSRIMNSIHDHSHSFFVYARYIIANDG